MTPPLEVLKSGPSITGKPKSRVANRVVQPARLEFPLLDPQVARTLGIVAANLLDEAA
jgi:hypothetical protein